MHVSNEQLKKFIIDTSLVSIDDIESAERKAKGTNSPFGEILASLQILSQLAMRGSFFIVSCRGG